MLDLKDAITIVEIIVAVIAIILLGDYLGHKMRRWRLVIIAGFIVLACVIAFAIYAAIMLA